RLLEHHEDAVEDDGHHQDVDGVPEAEAVDGREHAHVPSRARRTAAAILTAWKGSSESWVRMRGAAPDTARAAAASDPGRRSAGSSTPAIAPMNDLRETPTQIGCPSGQSAESSASTAASHSCHATPWLRKNPMPGSTAMTARSMPAAR